MIRLNVFYKRIALFFLALTVLSTNSLTKDYYVSALIGNDTNDGITSEAPFLTIQKAADLTLPGDTVYIMNGTYSETKLRYVNHALVLYIDRSGTKDAYITYINYPGHQPKIDGTNCRWGCVDIRANYIRFEGIELEGANRDITYKEARTFYDSYVNDPDHRDWDLLGYMNTNGLNIGMNVIDNPFHHIEVRSCTIHDFPGGGISGSDYDYIRLENNIVYNNSWYGMYQTSGISVYHLKNLDEDTASFKNIVRGNICYNNKTMIPWAGNENLSDGNGIIIDDSRNSQISGGVAYKGKTLVENNISYNNGGSGIHAYSSNNVYIINNTAYNNGTVVGYPEIFGHDGSNVRIYNNIMYARTGGASNQKADGTSYDYNMYFNGPAFSKGTHDTVADPKFVKLALDETADFSLRSTSPAINSGALEIGKFSLADINGNVRPVGSRPDRGAYESPYLELAEVPEMLVWHGGVLVSNGSEINFGNVYFNMADTLEFNIQNIGKDILHFSTNSTIEINGEGYSLIMDVPDSLLPGTIETFKISLLTTEEDLYVGSLGIINDDAYENPFLLSLVGKGKDPSRSDQLITFNALPVMYTHSEDLDPGATSSAGLKVSYISSDTSVAVIRDNKIRVVGIGHSIITAVQTGDANTHAADSLYQMLSVIPYSPLSDKNLVSNPSFDTDASKWSFILQNSSLAEISSVEKAGYASKVANITISSPGSSGSPYDIQLGTTISVKSGKNYSIMFKASAESSSMFNFIMIWNVSPWNVLFTKYNVSISNIPGTYGPFYFKSDASESLTFRMLLGTSSSGIFLDDVEIREVLVPEINLKEGSSNVASGANIDFGDLFLDSTKNIAITIENNGGDTLKLAGKKKVILTGNGFSLAQDAPSSIAPNASADFIISFTATIPRQYSGTLSILNNDENENPYLLTLSGLGVLEKLAQTITFDELPEKTVGDEDFYPGAYSSSALPISYSVSNEAVATIDMGKIHIEGPGISIITASQSGDDYTLPAEDVSRQLTVFPNDTVGINRSILAGEKILVYPNPASSVLNVIYSLFSTDNLHIQIVDTYGRGLKLSRITNKKESDSSFELDVSDFKDGVYMLKISDGKGKMQHQKFLIAH